MAKGRMMAAKRRQMILSILNKNSTISVAEVSKVCGVSQVTARADLDALAEMGLLVRTRGGATVSTGITPLPSSRLKQNLAAKEKIAECAVDFVDDGDSLLIGSGSTVLTFAKKLSEKRSLRVMSDDQDILDYAMTEFKNGVTISTGGVIEHYYHHMSGVFALKAVESVYYDKAFLSADAYQPHFGLLAEFEALATLKKAFIDHARESFLLLDATKIAREHVFTRFAGISDFDYIIMDEDPDDVISSELAELNCKTQLIIA
jgi:DeoR family transcriptional regulator of aga operon